MGVIDALIIRGAKRVLDKTGKRKIKKKLRIQDLSDDEIEALEPFISYAADRGGRADKVFYAFITVLAVPFGLFVATSSPQILGIILLMLWAGLGYKFFYPRYQRGKELRQYLTANPKKLLEEGDKPLSFSIDGVDSVSSDASSSSDTGTSSSSKPSKRRLPSLPRISLPGLYPTFTAIIIVWVVLLAASWISFGSSLSVYIPSVLALFMAFLVWVFLGVTAYRHWTAGRRKSSVLIAAPMILSILIFMASGFPLSAPPEYLHRYFTFNALFRTVAPGPGVATIFGTLFVLGTAVYTYRKGIL